MRRRAENPTCTVHKGEKKEVCGRPVVEARARARDGSRSRWGAPAEQGEAGSGHGRHPLPWQCGSGATALALWASYRKALLPLQITPLHLRMLT
jgi:hypothetical protein